MPESLIGCDHRYIPTPPHGYLHCEFCNAAPPRPIETPKWTQSPAEIGSQIASDFYPITSLSHSDLLRREVIKAIEAEREVTKHYMTQMGRWWEKFNA